MSARADLCGGRSAMIVPTATSLTIRLLTRDASNETFRLKCLIV